MSLNKTRASNFELLRIVSMLMIIAHHIAVHGGYSFLEDSITLNQVFIRFITFGGKVGVTIFIFISGYFMIDSTKIKLSKVLKLWGELLFYSVGIYAVCCILGIADFSYKQLIKQFLPISYNGWWFASVYFIIYLLSPYINTALKNISQKQYKNLIAIILALWCIIPTITNQKLQSNNLIWCICLYIMAGYFKRFGDNIKLKSSTGIILGTIMIFITFGLVCLYDYLGLNFEYFAENATRFYGLQTITVFLISTFLFIGFARLKIKYNPLINKLALVTFGVYLLHDSSLLRKFLWRNVFELPNHFNQDYFILYAIAIIFIVYLICSAIDLARIYVVEKPYMRLINKLEKRIEDKFKIK